MNRIDKTFDRLKKEEKKALITFITAGDPAIEITEKLVFAMEEAGADLIELGVPFSDPVAEGPVIQAASERALQSGTTLVSVFALVEGLRKKTQIPLLLMMYRNSIYKYGDGRFFEDCVKNGIDGVIVPDLPFEERREIAETASKRDVHLINLVAPTSGERIKKIAPESGGFLYCVSSLGVTGQRHAFATDFESFFRQIRLSAPVPAALGFGISKPEHVRQLKSYCDAVIVGSAFVKLIEEYGEEAVEPVKRLTAELKKALRED